METVVVVLMILVSFNFLLKLTYCKLWTVGVIAVSACLFQTLLGSENVFMRICMLISCKYSFQ